MLDFHGVKGAKGASQRVFSGDVAARVRQDDAVYLAEVYPGDLFCFAELSMLD